MKKSVIEKITQLLSSNIEKEFNIEITINEKKKRDEENIDPDIIKSITISIKDIDSFLIREPENNQIIIRLAYENEKSIIYKTINIRKEDNKTIIETNKEKTETEKTTYYIGFDSSKGFLIVIENTEE
ncbi:hypothetical protein SBFV2_gp05 [Sulfolobales Beppu filamentous virus 2]|uniref:Uncharacterized protein n=1 Tax=Sulfolobales Beppu filamentous virus 2 TaxID=2493123 RepID=A0A3Q8Q6Z6_9VIRU|nr:hypothetical protein HOU84_gp05 [Sulfolobales Beppu filamentous virus 2]AZI75772.1 hypothetical protein SBFV2_gp05 [Sulfolobales Beppu filamentous virus 2]